MGTKREELEAANRGEGSLGKAADDEPVFILRAQDELASRLVRQWAVLAQTKGSPRAKYEEAHALADRMEAWPNRKIPD